MRLIGRGSGVLWGGTVGVREGMYIMNMVLDLINSYKHTLSSGGLARGRIYIIKGVLSPIATSMRPSRFLVPCSNCPVPAVSNSKSNIYSFSTSKTSKRLMFVDLSHDLYTPIHLYNLE
jgi:hypothetical protein